MQNITLLSPLDLDKNLILNQTKILKDIAESTLSEQDFIDEIVPYLSFITLKPSTCTHKKLLVNLSPFTDLVDEAAWLKKYSKYICFKESYYYIELIHTIDKTTTIDDEINVKLLPNKVPLKDIFKMIKYSFDDFDYEKYMCFEIIPFDPLDPTTPKIDITLVDDLSADPGLIKTYYSFPFFRSILEINKITDFDKCYFNFAEVEINSVKTIAIRVELPDGVTTLFYDYTHIPGSSALYGGGSVVSEVKRMLF